MEKKKAIKISQSTYNYLANMIADKTDSEENVHDVHYEERPKESFCYVREEHQEESFTATRDNHTIIDPLINTFEATVWEQQMKVLESGKYPHPIHKDNHTAKEWMNHQMSEFADALVYHECLNQTIEEVADNLEHLISILEGGRNKREDYILAQLHETLNRLT